VIQSLQEHRDAKEEIKEKARRVIEGPPILSAPGYDVGILWRDFNCACVIEEHGSRMYEYTAVYIENLHKTSQLLEREEPESIIEKYRLRHIYTAVVVHVLYAFKQEKT
jgi:hypothetical protein